MCQQKIFVNSKVIWTAPNGVEIESDLTDGFSYSMVLDDVSSSDNGRYRCKAETQLTPDNRITRTDSINIQIYDRPALEITNIESPDPTSIVVIWTLPYDEQIPFDKCQMLYGTQRTGPWFKSSADIDPEVLSYTVTGLEPNTDYYIQLICTSQFGDIPNIAGPVQTKEAPPSKPINVVSNDLPSTCEISWDSPLEQNGIITSYTLYFTILARTPDGVNPNDKTTSQVVISNANGLSYNFTKSDMVPYSRYVFTVSASTSVGEGETCDCVEVFCTTNPSAPSEVSTPKAVGGVDKATNTFMIELVPASKRNGPISCYEVVLFPYDAESGVKFGNHPDDVFPPERVNSYAQSGGVAGSPYTAFIVDGSSITEQTRVTIGDGSTSQCNQNAIETARRKRQFESGVKTAENGALTPGLTFTAFIRAYAMVDENQVQYSSSSFMDPVLIPTAEPPEQQPNQSSLDPLVIYVAVGAVVAVLFCVCFIAVCISCRHRRKKNVPFKSRGQASLMGPDYEMHIRRTGSKSKLIHSVEDSEKRRSAASLQSIQSQISQSSVRYQPDVHMQTINEGFDPDQDYTYITDEATDYRIMWDQLMLGQTVLGTGVFGDVIQGVVFKKNKDTSKVAVRKWKISEADTAPLAAMRKDFIAEFEVMKKIGYHPNIIGLVGTCNHDGFMYVATELAANGNLRAFLRKSRRSLNGQNSSTIPSQQLFRFATDIAAGMEHLASKGIIHRDLAARNILLNEALRAKISDFGMAKEGEDTYVKTSKARVPVRWMAPESLERKVYTTKSDVWSFGILLWEIATLGGTPYPNEDPKYMIPLLRSGYRMSKPNNCLNEMYAIMTQCWHKDPEERPPFDELTPKLYRMLEDEETYLSTIPNVGFTFEPIVELE
ncbi:uncharacterized protein [Amphiura filiformis]|uniref:uncharacterized protein isoform X1 n=1 Tax=Amphiura filiformis TaxID=82378 RepID=UPI003B2144CC